MTDEAILAVIGTAVSIAQFVPLLSKDTPKRGRVVAAFTISFVVGGGALWYREQWKYRELVHQTKQHVLGALTKPKTFEELLSDLYYPSYRTLEDALDEMIAERTLEHRRVAALSPTGDTLDVRVYALPRAAAPRRAAPPSR